MSPPSLPGAMGRTKAVPFFREGDRVRDTATCSLLPPCVRGWSGACFLNPFMLNRDVRPLRKPNLPLSWLSENIVDLAGCYQLLFERLLISSPLIFSLSSSPPSLWASSPPRGRDPPRTLVRTWRALILFSSAGCPPRFPPVSPLLLPLFFPRAGLPRPRLDLSFSPQRDHEFPEL